jgi:hypothetical protein
MRPASTSSVTFLRDLEVGSQISKRCGVDLLAEGRVVEGKPAVGDLCSQGDVLWPLGAEVDRKVGTQRVRDGPE